MVGVINLSVFLSGQLAKYCQVESGIEYVVRVHRSTACLLLSIAGVD